MQDDQGQIAKDSERYERAAHRVQTAIAFHPDRPRDEYKDLRTGVDLSKSDLGGLATLLIEKGIITKAEYIAAIADFAEREASTKEDELSTRYGINVSTI